MISHLLKNHLAQMFLSLWHNRDLVLQLIKRDVLTRYRSSFGGLLWLLLAPLLMLSLYTIVFGVFLKVQWPGVSNTLMYSLVIYIALIVVSFFSECLSRAPSIIVSNPNFVTKIIFPLEIFPWVIVGTALCHLLVSIGILAFFCLFILGQIHATIFLLPLLFLPLILVALGISWFLCSAGVFVRDIAHLMVFIIQVVMYLSPVFYSTSMVPEKFQKILFLNPLTFIIEQARALIIFGHLPQWSHLGIYFIVSICIACLGFLWFQNTKDGFADVL
jgi:lipopolysaccharide transport system permease protein